MIFAQVHLRLVWFLLLWFVCFIWSLFGFKVVKMKLLSQASIIWPHCLEVDFSKQVQFERLSQARLFIISLSACMYGTLWCSHYVDEENSRTLVCIRLIKIKFQCLSSRYTTFASAACMSQKGRRSSRSRSWCSVGIVARDVCQASSLTASTTSPSRSLITKEKGLLAKARVLRHLREVCSTDVGWCGCSAGHHEWRKMMIV